MYCSIFSIGSSRKLIELLKLLLLSKSFEFIFNIFDFVFFSITHYVSKGKDKVARQWSYGVVVSTQDFEFCDLGSNPGRTFFYPVTFCILILKMLNESDSEWFSLFSVLVYGFYYDSL